MILIAAFLMIAPLGGQDGWRQSREHGLTFDCALQPRDTRDKAQFKPLEGSTIRQVYVWFGRFRPFGKKPVPLMVDRSGVVAGLNQEYHAVYEWPARFRVSAETPAGIRALHVDGTKPVPGRPGHFWTMSQRIWPGATTTNAKISELMIGDCAITPDVPYSEFESRRTAS